MSNKYHARRVEMDGQVFDSGAEGRYHRVLKIREAAGEIRDLQRQVKYTLQEAFVDSHGRRVGGITYTGDFQYVEVVTGRLVCCEVKGARTRDWVLREKLFRYRLRDLVELVIIPASEV